MTSSTDLATGVQHATQGLHAFMDAWTKADLRERAVRIEAWRRRKVEETARRARWEAMTLEEKRQSTTEAMARFAESVERFGHAVRKIRLREETRRTLLATATDGTSTKESKA